MAASVFQKLNLKDQGEIVVLNAPESFEPELAGLTGVKVARKLGGPAEFVLAFVSKQKDADALPAVIARKAPGDAIVWVAHPKQSSKKVKCEFSTTGLWEAMGALGFEGVRRIAIDEDWTALRYRRVEFIKTMTRDVSGARSAVGKARTAKP